MLLMSSGLSREQLEMIEEKRRRAMELKRNRQQSNSAAATSNCTWQQPPTKKSYPPPTAADGVTVLTCSLTDSTRFLVSWCKYDKKLIDTFHSIPSKKYVPDTGQWSFLVSEFDRLAGKIAPLSYRLSGFSPDNLPGKVTSNQIDVNKITNDDVPAPKKITAKCCLISHTRFEVEMAYHEECINVFKKLSTRSYNASTRIWNFHLCDYNSLVAEVKNEVKEVCLERLPKTVLSTFKHVISGKETTMTTSDSKPMVADLSSVEPQLVEALFPFQRDGVNFAISKKGRVLLADDMGLGKTVQSICVAAYYREKWPLLIVCPSSVRLMWKESFLRWLPSTICDDDIDVIMTGKDAISTLRPITVVSYDLLTRLRDKFKGKRFQVAILDESHFIKNIKSARTQAAMQVLKPCEHLLLLSGTPALSRPLELFPQLAVLRPDLFPRFQDFGQRYCAPKKTFWCWDYSGSSNAEELRLVMASSMMIRRTKACVLSQLPPKIRRAVVVDVGATKLTQIQKDNFKQVKQAMGKHGLSGIEKHGQLLTFFNETARIKSPAVVAYINDLLEGDEKFLVFAHHQSMLNAIQMQLEKKKVDFIRIDGRTRSDRRQHQVKRFQQECNCKVALLSITAANMGITLSAAALVVFAELFWNPGILIQAEDRCYRIGQCSVVNVHYLIGKGTSDDYIWQIVKEKLKVLEKAGLNENNFNDTEHEGSNSYQGSTHMSDEQQKTILSYFKPPPPTVANSSSKEEEKVDDEFGDDDSFDDNCVDVDLLLQVAEEAERDSNRELDEKKNRIETSPGKSNACGWKPPFKNS